MTLCEDRYPASSCSCLRFDCSKTTTNTLFTNHCVMQRVNAVYVPDPTPFATLRHTGTTVNERSIISKSTAPTIAGQSVHHKQGSSPPDTGRLGERGRGK